MEIKVFTGTSIFRGIQGRMERLVSNRPVQDNVIPQIFQFTVIFFSF